MNRQPHVVCKVSAHSNIYNRFIVGKSTDDLMIGLDGTLCQVVGGWMSFFVQTDAFYPQQCCGIFNFALLAYNIRRKNK